jgi:hypothetical protein
MIKAEYTPDSIAENKLFSIRSIRVIVLIQKAIMEVKKNLKNV